MRDGIVHPAAEGARLTSWQEHLDCDNRYVPALYLSITGKCNFNCRHCFNAADNAPLMSQWDYDEYLAFLDECCAAGIHAFFITGGEPMVHLRFMDMMRAIYERDMFVFRINTNGSFLTPENLDEMRSFGCVPQTWLSFDGIGQHDWMRGRKGAEEQALAAIRLCVEKGFPTGVHVNAHRGNADVLSDTMRLMANEGVDIVRVLRTTEVPRWTESAPDMALSFSEYYEMGLSLIRDYVQLSPAMDLQLWQYITIDAKEHSYHVTPVHFADGAYDKDFPLCLRNRCMPSIGPEGDVFPCHPMSGYMHGHGIDMGNVHREGLKAILQKGPLMSYVCAGVGKVAEGNERCGSCRHFRYCGGGCRAVALVLSGDLYGPDPTKCVFFDEGYYERTVEALPGWRNTSPVTIAKA